MSLSIHYKGEIKDVGLIPKLIEEVKDISSTLQWHRYLFNDDIAKGICLSPPGCEPLIIAFSKNAKLCDPFLLYHNIHPGTFISVKTQYAGIEVHKAIIKLLKYLNANYLSEFELRDEGATGRLTTKKCYRGNSQNTICCWITSRLR